jgi:hypothetical protein
MEREEWAICSRGVALNREGIEEGGGGENLAGAVSGGINGQRRTMMTWTDQ